MLKACISKHSHVPLSHADEQIEDVARQFQGETTQVRHGLSPLVNHADHVLLSFHAWTDALQVFKTLALCQVVLGAALKHLCNFSWRCWQEFAQAEISGLRASARGCIWASRLPATPPALTCSQVPPAYMPVKQKGRPVYDLAKRRPQEQLWVFML